MDLSPTLGGALWAPLVPAPRLRLFASARSDEPTYGVPFLRVPFLGLV